MSIPYAYAYIESIHCILLSLLELNAVLLTSSVDKLCFSLLNLWYDFNFFFFLFMNSLWFYLKLFSLTLLIPSWFILFSGGATPKQSLESSNLSFCFLTFFLSFDFAFSGLSSVK